MTTPAAEPRGATGAAGRALPQATFVRLLSAAVAAVMLLWLPLSVLPILDGLLFVSPPLEVLRDLALLYWLGLLPAAALAALGAVAARGVRAAGAGLQSAALVGWSLVLLPLAWACAWQAARVAWQWLRAIGGVDLVISQEMRAAAVVLLAIGMVGLVRRWPASALMRGLARSLNSATPVAVGMLALAAAVVLAEPPAVLRSGSGPAVGSPPVAGPDIFVISLDAVAAADADACNPASATMPRLARFAAGVSCFTRFYAASNFTTPTTSTMESGLLPWTHFATQPDAEMAVGTRANTMAAVLQAQGWRTHSITDNLLASPRHRGTYAGYTSSGFAHTTLYGNWFREAMTVFPDTALPRLAATAVSFLGAFDMALHGARSPYASERTYEEVLTLLAREGRAAPQFIWAHTLPPHSPYLPPPATKYRLLPRGELETWRELMPDNETYAPSQQALVDKHRLRYRESMMAADAALGAFLDELERQGRLDSALVVITSDHGESFEKGYLGHAGPLIHDALTRVPLLVKLPGQREGRVLQMPVSQADLAPTLLDLAGAPPLPVAEGRSLRALLEGRPLQPAPVFTMTLERQSRFRPLASGHYAVIDGDDKLTMTLDAAAGARRPSTLYSLVLDPSESLDLSAGRPQRVQALEALLHERLTAAERARLRANGRTR